MAIYLIEISDSPTTGLKRKVRWEGGFYFNKRDEFIKLFTMCESYKNINGAYGDLINTQEVGTFERILTSTNNIKVNPLNGKQCSAEITNPGTINEVIVWKQKNNNQVVASVVGQFDYFEDLIFNNTVNIPSIIAATVQDEDEVNHSYDK